MAQHGKIGFRIRTDVPRASAEIVDRFHGLATPNVADAMALVFFHIEKRGFIMIGSIFPACHCFSASGGRISPIRRHKWIWVTGGLLAAAGLAAVAGPILIGVMNAPKSQAQSKSEALTFEVASVKPSDPNARRVGFQFTPGGGLNVVNMDLKQLIAASRLA